jgi:hypothetical protein
MSELIPCDQVAFDYNELDPEDRKYVKDKVGVIRLLARQTAESVLHIGRHLIEVRQRLKGRFLQWVETEFSWKKSNVYDMINAAEAFGMASEIRNKFDASAMYVLAAPKTPPAAREYAIGLARDGEYITHRHAREIIDSLQPVPEPNNATARKILKGNPTDTEHPDREPEDIFGEYKTLWLAFKKLILEHNLVTFSWEPHCIDDSNDTLEADPETHQYKGHFKVTTWKHSADKPVMRSSTTYLETLILEVTDSHPMQKCTKCKLDKRLYEDFCSKKNNRFNRSRTCKTCEVKRVAAAKLAKKRRDAERAANRPA